MYFLFSKAYHEFLGFIMALNNAVKEKTRKCEYVKSEVQVVYKIRFKKCILFRKFLMHYLQSQLLLFRTVKKSSICLKFWINGLMKILPKINLLGLVTQRTETGLPN